MQHTLWYWEEGNGKHSIPMCTLSNVCEIPWRHIHWMILLMTSGNRDSCLVTACYHWDKHSTVCRHIFRDLVLVMMILVLINFGFIQCTTCFHAQSADIRLVLGILGF